MDKVKEVADAATRLLESASVDSGCKGPAFDLFATEMAPDQAEDESELAPVTGTDRPPLDVHRQQFDMTGDIVATPVRPQVEAPAGRPASRFPHTEVRPHQCKRAD